MCFSTGEKCSVTWRRHPSEEDLRGDGRKNEGVNSSESLDSSVLLGRLLGTLVFRVGILVMSLLLAVFVARSLEPAERGHFALLQSLNGLTGISANFAIASAAIFHIGKRLITPREAAGAACTLALLSGALGAAAIVPIALVARDSVFSGISTSLIIGAILLATAVLIRDYLGGVLVSISRPLSYQICHAAQPVGMLLLLLLFLATSEGSLGVVYRSWVGGVSLSGIISIGITAALLGSRPRFRSRQMFTLARFGMRTYPALLLRFLNLRLDQFLVVLLSSSAALGQYAVAVNVGELLFQVPAALLWTLSGVISSLDTERAAQIVTQFSRFAVILLMGASLVVAAAAPWGVPFLFGTDYFPAWRSLVLLLPGMVFYAPAIIIAEYFIVQRGQPSRAALIAGSSVLSSIVFNGLLTPSLEASGASIASSLSYLVMLVVALELFQGSSGTSVRSFLTFSRGDAIVATQFVRNIKERMRRS